MKLWEVLMAGFFADKLLEERERQHNELMDRLDPRNELDYENDEWDGISDPW